MKTIILLCHCGNHCPPPPFEGCVFNHPAVITSIVWALTVIILGAFALCYLKKRIQLKKDMADADREHELKLKDKNYEIEDKWFDKNKQTKEDELAHKIKEYNELTKITQEDELARKINEFNELTIHQKIMDKVTGVDKEMKDFKEALEELKKKYETLDGEIEQIIIKKKQ